MAIHGERGEEAGDLRGAHLGRVALVVEEDIALDPRDVSVFGPAAVMAGAEGSAHTIEEARLGRIRLTGLADGKTCVGRLVPHGGVYDGSARRKDDHFRGPLLVLAG